MFFRMTVAVLAAASAFAAETGRQHFVYSSGTASQRVAPEQHAREMAAKFGIGQAGVNGIYLHKSYRTQHNGVTHQIYRQQYRGVDVHGMEWVVNTAPDGSILNSGGSFTDAPAVGASLPDTASAMSAVRAAVNVVNPRLSARFLPIATRIRTKRPGGLVFAAGPLGAEVHAEQTWFPLNGELIPAWMFSVMDSESPESYEVIVEAGTDRILARNSTTFYQRPVSKALVFTGDSPQANPNPGVRVAGPPPMVNRVLVPLEGDPKASPEGWVSGTSTVGNNTIAGQNSLARDYLKEPRTASLNAQGEFSFPLELSAASNPFDYYEASTTNLFYWVNRAHDFFHSIGLDEAAGSFQQNNFGRGGVGGDPLYAYTHYGVAGAGGAASNNAFFTRRSADDGSDSMIAMFVTSGGALRIPGDTSLDAGVVIHEYTHGVSTRLVRNGYSTSQGGAMGEAWSDFFALEMLTPEGAPLDGAYPVGEYFTQSWGNGIRTRPASTNLEVNPLTYASLGRVVSFPSVHADGEIWTQCLWDMRANLIRQFGEREGRRRVRLLVMDGMKLAVPAPSMVDARDAILLADRVSFRGDSQQQIWQAFAKRGLGALAFAPSGDSKSVIASLEVPSGPSVALYGDRILIGQAPLIVVSDPALTGERTSASIKTSSGDLETVALTRRGAVFTGSIVTSQFGTDLSIGFFGSAAILGDGTLQVVANDKVTVTYKQASTETNVKPGYAAVRSAAPAELRFPNEQRLNVDFIGTTITLPFSFPFYGRLYRTADIQTGGRIGFGLRLPIDFCYDDATFRSDPSIAPLFTNMVVTSLFDPANGVFFSRQSEDSVTFRWKGNLLSGTLEPMNFAATLFQDGRIRFDYGTGNPVLLASTPAACGRGPVAGLSAGLGNYADSFPYPATFDKAPSVTFAYPFGEAEAPQGFLDSAVASGTNLLLQGAAYDANSSIARADVLVDGIFSGSLNLGLASPAACARFGLPVPCLDARGLVGVVSLVPRRLSTGAHTVQLRVTNAKGATSTVPAEPMAFQYREQGVAERQVPEGKIESPASGATVSGVTLIRGYAYMPLNRISRVDILLDGGATIGGILYGLPRTDICNPLPATPIKPNCPTIGFQVNLNTVGAPIVISDGEHTLSLRVTDNLGNVIAMPETEVRFKVENGGVQSPAGVMATPEQNQTVSGDMLIWGYAWSPFPGRRVVTVALVVDGVTGQALNYGEERGNECRTIENAPAACPNIGYSGTLDTRTLSNGLHSIGVRVINDRGESVVIPTAGRWGVNVFVRN